MTLQEKKYRVDDFAKILKKINELNLKPSKKEISLHYYAKLKGKGVIKLVEYDTKCEIHKLQESAGKFSLTNIITLKNLEAGLTWFKSHSYEIGDKVKMAYTEYPYKDGRIGLYIINDSLYSVILDFPADQHIKIEKELDLSSAEQIKVPYNKYWQLYTS